MTVFLNMLRILIVYNRILVKGTENTRKIGRHITRSDDISNILRTTENNHIAFIVNHAVMRPNIMNTKCDNYQPQAIF